MFQGFRDFSSRYNINSSWKCYCFEPNPITYSEYKILPKMIEDNSIRYINKLAIEWHHWIMPEFKEKTNDLIQKINSLGIEIIPWG